MKKLAKFCFSCTLLLFFIKSYGQVETKVIKFNVPSITDLSFENEYALIYFDKKAIIPKLKLISQNYIYLNKNEKLEVENSIEYLRNATKLVKIKMDESENLNSNLKSLSNLMFSYFQMGIILHEGEKCKIYNKEKKTFVNTLKYKYDFLSKSYIYSFVGSDTYFFEPEMVIKAEGPTDIISVERHEEKSADDVYEAVEIPPRPKPNMESYVKYISDNIQYPKAALENKIQGKVFVKFVVNKNGELSDFLIFKGLGNGCDDEAIRVLKAGPSWIPGELKSGTGPVRILYIFPVIFSLQK